MLDLRLFAILILGTLALTAVGTLLAAMTVQTRSRETLLPILMLPTSLPVLTLVVRASNGIIQAQPDELWLATVPTLILLDLVYAVMCFLLFPYVLED
jgi:heme exporter protein B